MSQQHNSLTNKKTEFVEEWDWETGNPTGKPVERKLAHKNGIPHEGVHLWIIRNFDVPEILFQRRAKDKDMFPGCLDITVGGHVPFGQTDNKIQKEAQEEIGINPSDDELADLGYYRYEEKYGDLFHREFQRVYLLTDNRRLDQYMFTDSEVDGIFAVKLTDLEKLLQTDFTFSIEGYEDKQIISKTISRKEFHPLLFTEPMKEYMDVVLKAAKELLSSGKIKTKMRM